MSDASQFYTGLVARVYDHLVAHKPDAELYARWIGADGQPALELGCGSGDPLLDLVGRGIDVEGLDASADMLARCRARAAALGLDVTLHHQEMQSFRLPSRYRTIFLAGPTFMLVTDLADAQRALVRIHEHLAPGGRAVIPLFLPPAVPDAKRAGRGWSTRAPATLPDGTVVRLSEQFEHDTDARLLRATLRYELLADGHIVDTLERPWNLRWYEQDEFRRMLLDAGFTDVAAMRGNGKPSAATDAVFMFIATRA